MISASIFTSPTESIDITGMISEFGWSGDINTLPRKVEISIVNINDITSGKKLIKYTVGNLVKVFFDKKEIFRGYIFSISTDNKGIESFTAYDELIYATKNSDTILVINKLASDIVSDHLKKFGLPVGDIERTTYKIKKQLFQAQAISKIWEDCLEEDKANTSKTYHIYSNEGKISMCSRQKAAIATIKIDNIISGSNEISIEDLRTQVMVTKGSLDGEGEDKAYSSYTESDNEGKKKYGTMQHVESVDEKSTKDEMKAKAKALLNTLNKPTTVLSVECIGDISCITGRMIEIKDTVTDIVGQFYITSDSHTISNNVHKMTLQLSKNLE